MTKPEHVREELDHMGALPASTSRWKVNRKKKDKIRISQKKKKGPQGDYSEESEQSLSLLPAHVPMQPSHLQGT